MAKIIAITGVYRSGSTWMFNATKTILKKANKTVTWENNPYIEGAFDSDADFHIMKMHEFHPKLRQSAHVIFTSNRNFDDVKQSWQRLCPDKPIDSNTVRDAFIEYGKWTLFTNYDMNFNKLIEDPKDVLIEMCAWLLQGTVNEQFIDEVLVEMENIKPPKKGFDPETLLFDKHISDKYKK